MVWVKRYHDDADWCLCCITPYKVKEVVTAYLLGRWPERFVGADKRDLSLIVHFNDHRDTTISDIHEVVTRFNLSTVGTCSRTNPVEICNAFLQESAEGVSIP